MISQQLIQNKPRMDRNKVHGINVGRLKLITLNYDINNQTTP